MRILLVEDDPHISATLQRYVRTCGYTVTQADTGAEARTRAARAVFNLIILDADVCGCHGLHVCADLRDHGVTTPILMLIAGDTVADRVNSVAAGADDYLAKPVACVELLARIRALELRHTSASPSSELSYGALVLNTRTHHARYGARTLDLTALEWKVLEWFLRHPEQVVSRTQLLDQVWSEARVVQPSVVDVCICSLRRKLRSPDQPELITTVRGFGYRLVL